MELEYVSPTTRKLADILGMEPVTSMEEVARIFETTVEKAQVRGLGFDEAWAAKVRKELPMGVRLERLEPRICELDSYQTGAVLELFGPIEKIRLLKLRGDKCGDRNARDIVRIQLEGNPTATRDIERKGLIAWWNERRSVEETVQNLVRIGFSEQEAKEKAGAKAKPEAPEEKPPVEEKSWPEYLQGLKERMERRMEE